jgi:hypothetical protein
LRLAGIDAPAIGIRYLDRAKRRLEILRERQRKFARRARHCAADQRTGVIKKGVGMRGDIA